MKVAVASSNEIRIRELSLRSTRVRSFFFKRVDDPPSLPMICGVSERQIVSLPFTVVENQE
jgi:hypothetical protein